MLAGAEISALIGGRRPNEVETGLELGNPCYRNVFWFQNKFLF